MVAGYYFPLVGLVVGVLVLLGRTLYTIMYNNNGGNSRKLGAYMYLLPSMLLFIAVIFKISFDLVNFDPS